MFNAGVLVLYPDREWFNHMIAHLHDYIGDSRLLDTQEQGWMNLYLHTFGNIEPLNNQYNYDATAYRYKYSKSYEELITSQGGPVVVHWPSKSRKPWQIKTCTRKYNQKWDALCHELALSICSKITGETQWVAKHDAISGKVFYKNTRSKERAWRPPAGVVCPKIFSGTAPCHAAGDLPQC